MDTSSREARPHVVVWALGKPREGRALDAAEAAQILDLIAEAGTPVVMFTDVDPTERADLAELVRRGTRLGLRVAVTPAPHARITDDDLLDLGDAGLARLSVVIDGLDAAQHAAGRGSGGSVDHAFALLRRARELGIATQADTLVTLANLDDLVAFAHRLAALDVEVWNVSLPVDDRLDPETFEEVLRGLVDVAEWAPFEVKTTAAPQFRRALVERRRARAGVELGRGRLEALGARARQEGRPIDDGDGLLFIDAGGLVFPGPSLLIECGDARRDDPLVVYREHPLLRRLRDHAARLGKCGRCEFGILCGGCRARAFCTSGDVMSSDPSCGHRPIASSRSSSDAAPAVSQTRNLRARAEVARGARSASRARERVKVIGARTPRG
jgi:radical SAM protein with 4Fe4S-binding SPASM domain